MAKKLGDRPSPVIPAAGLVAAASVAVLTAVAILYFGLRPSYGLSGAIVIVELVIIFTIGVSWCGPFATNRGDWVEWAVAALPVTVISLLALLVDLKNYNFLWVILTLSVGLLSSFVVASMRRRRLASAEPEPPALAKELPKPESETESEPIEFVVRSSGCHAGPAPVVVAVAVTAFVIISAQQLSRKIRR